uniref:Vomeronasal type-1 receptor n=1 Tax=Plectus sambesii TaxID=2011161 RepID=A0A914UKP5_9BILA
MSPSVSANVLLWPPRRFLFIDACLFLASGLFAFFLPSVASNLIFTNDTDGVHWHIMRCIGGQLIGNAFVLYRLSRSTHAETHTSCFIMRILTSSLMMIVVLNANTYLKDEYVYSLSPNLVSDFLSRRLVGQPLGWNFALFYMDHCYVFVSTDYH